MLGPAEAVPSTAELALSAVERVTSTVEREPSAAELVLSPVEAAFHYTLPPVVIPSARLRFEPQRVDRQLLQREMAAHGVLTLPAWREQTHPAQDGQKAFRPLTPMRQGHILNLIAAGYLDNMSLAREQIVLMLKGQAYKQTIQQESAETDEEGNTTLTTTYTEQFQVRIKTLEPDGRINTLEGERLHGFMADWLTPITDRPRRAVRPVYSFDLNGYQAVLDTLNQGRTIPNTDMRGLAPAQQHAVAAAATRLRQTLSGRAGCDHCRRDGQARRFVAQRLPFASRLPALSSSVRPIWSRNGCAKSGTSSRGTGAGAQDHRRRRYLLHPARLSRRTGLWRAERDDRPQRLGLGNTPTTGVARCGSNRPSRVAGTSHGCLSAGQCVLGTRRRLPQAAGRGAADVYCAHPAWRPDPSHPLHRPVALPDHPPAYL